MPQRDYYVMSGNTTVAKWENNELTVINDSLLPLYLKRIHNADMWLETRAIDSHRANSRLLKKALRLKEKDDINTVVSVNAATITDNYWIKPLNSKLKYNDVRFSNDYFAGLALKGDYSSFNKAANSKHSNTPELTNIGSFEKCWRLINGKWWMFKSANHEEQFSELFIYRLGKAIGMNMALYERGDKCVKTLDFTGGASVNFEPAFTFMGDNEDYEDVYEKLREICPQAIEDFVKMIFLDTIVANPDRHTANFGLLRSTETGELLGFAPVFDHNMALISRGYPKAPTKNDILINLFNDFLLNHPEYKQLIPVITEEIIINIIKELNMKVKSKEIVNLVMKRYEMIVNTHVPKVKGDQYSENALTR